MAKEQETEDRGRRNEAEETKGRRSEAGETALEFIEANLQIQDKAGRLIPLHFNLK